MSNVGRICEVVFFRPGSWSTEKIPETEKTYVLQAVVDCNLADCFSKVPYGLVGDTKQICSTSADAEFVLHSKRTIVHEAVRCDMHFSAVFIDSLYVLAQSVDVFQRQLFPKVGENVEYFVSRVW